MKFLIILAFVYTHAQAQIIPLPFELPDSLRCSSINKNVSWPCGTAGVTLIKTTNMTRYQSHMQNIHNQATAQSIKGAVNLLTEDIIDFLIKAGVRQDGMLLKDIRNLTKYTYAPEKLKTNE